MCPLYGMTVTTGVGVSGGCDSRIYHENVGARRCPEERQRVKVLMNVVTHDMSPLYPNLNVLIILRIVVVPI